MPVIRITDTTMDRLKQWAVPLEDTPDDAIRKVLDAAEGHNKYTPNQERDLGSFKRTRRTQNGRLSTGLKTPQSAYNQPIMEALYELGGSARVREVLQVVEKKLKNTLTDVDYQKLPNSNSIRWENSAQWERFELVKDGLLKSESPTGVWELSSIGLQKIESRNRDA